jgi:hypothetical protein
MLTKVIQPVTAATDTDALGPHTEREDFRHQNPCNRSPAEGKIRNVDPDEDHSDPSSCSMLWPVVPVITAICADDTGDDEVAARHANSASNEDILATEFVDIEHCWDREQEFEDAYDPRGQQCYSTASETETTKDERAISKMSNVFYPVRLEHILTRNS